MRHFIVRTITGQVDPHALVTKLLPGPQWTRMLMYSVLIHACIATTVIFLKILNLQFRDPLPAVAYTVDLVEVNRKQTRKPAIEKSAGKIEQAKPKPEPKPEVKPEPKPEPKPKPKPEPKPVVEKKAPAEKKKIEVPKVVKAPEPKEKPAEVKTAPEPPKEKAPPPEPEPQVEPVPQVAQQVVEQPAPEPEPVAASTVDLDTENITPDLKWYIEMIRRKVWQNWIEPMHVLPPGTNARVVIRFEIGRDGRFASDPVIFESSNIYLLDQSGYRAVLRSAPFPPLPESFSGSSLGVRFGFEYGEAA